MNGTDFCVVFFYLNILICGIFYYKTRKTLKKYEKNSQKGTLLNKKKSVLEKSKIASNIIILQ